MKVVTDNLRSHGLAWYGHIISREESHATRRKYNIEANRKDIRVHADSAKGDMGKEAVSTGITTNRRKIAKVPTLYKV